MTGKLKKFSFGLAIVAAIIGLVVAIPVTYGARAISSVVVDVWVPKADGSGVLLTVYQPAGHGKSGSEAMTDQVVSDTDVRKIKGALGKTRVLYGFYSEGILTVKSPIIADAIFWRRNAAVQISLAKVGSDWQVMGVKQSFGHHVAAGKDIWSRILDAINGAAP